MEPNFKLTTMNYLKANLAEIYILASVLFYWTSTAVVFNPVALILLALFGFQLWKQFKGLGVGLGMLYLAINFVMFFALLSELREFSTVTSSFIQLLLVGGIYFFLNCLASIFMIKKYSKVSVLKTS